MWNVCAAKSDDIIQASTWETQNECRIWNTWTYTWRQWHGPVFVYVSYTFSTKPLFSPSQHHGGSSTKGDRTSVITLIIVVSVSLHLIVRPPADTDARVARFPRFLLNTSRMTLRQLPWWGNSVVCKTTLCRGKKKIWVWKSPGFMHIHNRGRGSVKLHYIFIQRDFYLYTQVKLHFNSTVQRYIGLMNIKCMENVQTKGLLWMKEEQLS